MTVTRKPRYIDKFESPEALYTLLKKQGGSNRVMKDTINDCCARWYPDLKLQQTQSKTKVRNAFVRRYEKSLLPVLEPPEKKPTVVDLTKNPHDSPEARKIEASFNGELVKSHEETVAASQLEEVVRNPMASNVMAEAVNMPCYKTVDPIGGKLDKLVFDDGQQISYSQQNVLLYHILKTLNHLTKLMEK